MVKTLKLEGGKTYTIIPTTQKEGEELEFVVHVYAQTKLAFKQKKGE